MRKLGPLILAAMLFVAPRAARAGWLVEGSLGLGWQTSPTTAREPTNIMIAPGYGVLDFLKLELGVLGNLGDVQNSQFDLELRPMVVVSPPLFPLYLRGVLAATNLFNGPRSFAYGGALGMSLGMLGAAVFVEAGLLPRSVDGTFSWVAEGRAGVSYEF